MSYGRGIRELDNVGVKCAVLSLFHMHNSETQLGSAKSFAKTELDRKETSCVRQL